MDLAVFSTAFILQFVGHRIGDYLLQTDYQAQNKAKSVTVRIRHCTIYSLAISLLVAVVFGIETAAIVYLLTKVEHLFIDSRWPVVGYKKLLEKVAGNKGFDIDKMPFFVLIEIDQSIHYLRCFVIALLIAYQVI